MTIDHEQSPIPVEAPDSRLPSVVGASRTGAMVGGGLMLLLVLLVILDITVIREFGFSFGYLPGLNTYEDICFAHHACTVNSIDILGIIAFILVTLVWLALGLAILVGAKNHLAKVAFAGLAAVFLFKTVPAIEGLLEIIRRSFRYVAPLTYLEWLLSIAISLLTPTALLLLALAGTRGHLNAKPLLVWAIVLLSASVPIHIIHSTLTDMQYPGDLWLDFLPGSIFAAVTLVPWIIVAATARARKPISPTPQPEWRPLPLGTS